VVKTIQFKVFVINFFNPEIPNLAFGGPNQFLAQTHTKVKYIEKIQILYIYYSGFCFDSSSFRKSLRKTSNKPSKNIQM